MKKILLVEDDEAIIFVYREILGKVAEVLVATTYGEFECLVTLQPDIVLTDFHFPGGNGNHVAQVAREKGVEHVILQMGDLSQDIKQELFNAVYEKIDFPQWYSEVIKIL